MAGYCVGKEGPRRVLVEKIYHQVDLARHRLQEGGYVLVHGHSFIAVRERNEMWTEKRTWDSYSLYVYEEE